MVQIRMLISQGSIVKLRRGTEGSRSGLASYSPGPDARIHLALPRLRGSDSLLLLDSMSPCQCLWPAMPGYQQALCLPC